MTDRAALEARWLDLTRRALPGVARERGWPVVADHCFQRILLDHAFGGTWYDHVAGRPAYAHADPAALARAVTLGEAALAGDADLAALNRQSLMWRGKAPSKPAGGTPISRPSQSRRTKIERTA
ncbi:GCN5-related N-acetyltransferase [uncultured Sphingomonas sp.]|uniref:GCN5-related N-acetyltransferase n=1 Tax=uncultured Sphingomonas sp. TaxID=158754 RepID=UPI0025FBAF17|nr:GCN5-related N-acetyltransferase [uncultured Sphingomonas sp.]